MKFILFFVVLLKCSITYTQTLEKFSETDTIFINFDNSNQFFKKSNYFGRSNDCSFNHYIYTLKINSIEYIDFLSVDYNDNCTFKPIQTEKFKVNKNFLKTNFYRTFDVKNIIDFGLREFFFFIYENKRRVYIIDNLDKKCGKVTIREVRIDSPFIDE